MLQASFGRHSVLGYLAAIIVALPIPISAQATLREPMQRTEAELIELGALPWAWQQSNCLECGLAFLPLTGPVKTKAVSDFLRALEVNKKFICDLYGVDGETYNLLAWMAVGILGRESKFFNSNRYQLKEALPVVVELLKVLTSDGKPITPNSRGPTQIKVVPERIAEAYGVTSDNLKVPENAAVATMGFLIESLEELQSRIVVNDLSYVNESNYVDYLPYIYFGGTRALIKGLATPETNSYVQEMKRDMTWVGVYEIPPEL